MKHPNEEQVILYHYGEAPGRDEVAKHLEVCESCRANYEALQREPDVIFAHVEVKKLLTKIAA